MSANESNKQESSITAVSTTAPISTAMPTALSAHKENHVQHGELIRDSIIGFSDGLTVPFALCAGLSALHQQRIVIIGGLAELFAGSISMGLGAYLASSSEKKHYAAEESRERKEVAECPEAEEEEIFEIFEQYGIRREESKGVVDGLKSNPEMWVQFMMDFELRLEKPERKRAWLEGLVMGVSYFVGGLLPMVPYFAFSHSVIDALFASIGITAMVLVVFGYVKALLIGMSTKAAIQSALQTLFIGAAAAGLSYGIVRLVNSSESL